MRKPKSVTERILGTKFTAMFDGSYAGEKLDHVKVLRMACRCRAPSNN